MKSYLDLEKNPVVDKSLRRLRAMGLNVKVLSIDPNECFVFVPIDDIVKLIDKQITFTNHRTYFETNQIVIRLWRE
jgi:hypothetical protein